jgi:hypothetical protein
MKYVSNQWRKNNNMKISNGCQYTIIMKEKYVIIIADKYVNNSNNEIIIMTMKM